MKKLLLILLSCYVTFLPGQSTEETAIRKVIETAGNGAYTNAYSQWADHWSNQDILFHYVNNQQHYLYEDWSPLAAQMRENMKAGPSEKMPFVERSNFQYRIDNNLAWVHFDQKDDNRQSKEQRVLAKENGQWKIINMTAVDISSFEKNGLIRRLLYFSYKADTPAEEIQLVKQKFQEMISLVDGMEKAVWMESPDADSPYRYSLLLEFVNDKAMKNYEAHPNHQLAIDKWKLYGGNIIGHTYQEK